MLGPLKCHVGLAHREEVGSARIDGARPGMMCSVNRSPCSAHSYSREFARDRRNSYCDVSCMSYFPESQLCHRNFRTSYTFLVQTRNNGPRNADRVGLPNYGAENSRKVQHQKTSSSYYFRSCCKLAIIPL